MHWEGYGVKVDKKEGRRWLEKAARGGDPPAMYRFAGVLKPDDSEAALRWYTRAARAEHPSAAVSGGMLAVELGKLTRAKELYRLAADAGHEGAKRALKGLRRAD
jgi:hypothetical protein